MKQLPHSPTSAALHYCGSGFACWGAHHTHQLLFFKWYAFGLGCSADTALLPWFSRCVSVSLRLLSLNGASVQDGVKGQHVGRLQCFAHLELPQRGGPALRVFSKPARGARGLDSRRGNWPGVNSIWSTTSSSAESQVTHHPRRFSALGRKRG